jgi:hypothetical protein
MLILISQILAPFQELTIKFISKPFISHFDGPYTLKPSPGVDNAWNSLLSDMHMRASAEELAIYGQKSVSLGGNDEYFVWLDVFHQLHCIVSTPLLLKEIPRRRIPRFSSCDIEHAAEMDLSRLLSRQSDGYGN